MPLLSRALLPLALGVVLAAGPSAHADEGGADPFAAEAPRVYRVGVGDLLTVRVFGQDEWKDAYTVDDDGQLDLPWVGPVQVAGLSVGQITRRITDVLAEGYFGAEGMLAYVLGVQRQEIRRDLAAVKHQDLAGSNIGDDHKEYFSGEGALKAGGKDNTMNQFG